MQFPPFPPVQPPNMGWQCPKCNTIYNPLVQTCGKCPVKVGPNVYPYPSVVPPVYPFIPYPTISGGKVMTVAAGRITANLYVWNSGCGGYANN